MKKKINIELIKLRNLHCGLGQTSFHFADGISKVNDPVLDFNFLVPENYMNYFGNNVTYTKYNRWKKFFPINLGEYDLWHATNQYPKYLPINKDKKTKIITTIHDLNFIYEKKESKGKTLLKNLQSIVNKSETIVVISEFVKSEVEEYLDLSNKPINVIYNGVNDLRKNKPIKPNYIDDSIKFFFSIGQFLPKKNFHVLLDLMKIIPEYNLYLAGSNNSEYGKYIQSLINSKNLSNVKLVGNITENEKTWFYENCDAFLFPSKFEGFGLPIIEALQFGNTVISSKMTSLPEIGKNYVSYWDHYDPEYMKEILIKALGDNNQSKITERMQYANTFSYKKNVELYIDIYKKTLGIN